MIGAWFEMVQVKRFGSVYSLWLCKFETCRFFTGFRQVDAVLDLLFGGGRLWQVDNLQL